MSDGWRWTDATAYVAVTAAALTSPAVVLLFQGCRIKPFVAEQLLHGLKQHVYLGFRLVLFRHQRCGGCNMPNLQSMHSVRQHAHRVATCNRTRCPTPLRRDAWSQGTQGTQARLATYDRGRLCYHRPIQFKYRDPSKRESRLHFLHLLSPKIGGVVG